MKTIGIFMPGRLNSERLPNKLILQIGNTCLWEIACSKLSAIKKVEKCVLISVEDDLTLGSIARKYNLNIIYRDEKTTKVDNPLNYVFKDVKYMKSDILMFLNPCLLFLSEKTIKTAIKKINKKNPYMESVKKFNNWIYDDKGLLFDLNLKEMNTKYLPEKYMAAHAFRVFNKIEFLKNGNMSIKNPSLFVLNEKECVDVDTVDDYLYAKWRWENCS